MRIYRSEQVQTSDDDSLLPRGPVVRASDTSVMTIPSREDLIDVLMHDALGDDEAYYSLNTSLPLSARFAQSVVGDA